MRLVAASSGGRQPYWQAGPEYSGYASGYYRGNGMDLFSTVLVGTMLGNMMMGGMYGGGWGGADGGGSDFGGDFGGGDFGGGFGGGDFGGGATSAVGDPHLRPRRASIGVASRRGDQGAPMNFSIRFTAALSTLAVIGGLAFAQPPSWAAPPDNDDRADAIRVDPPQTVEAR